MQSTETAAAPAETETQARPPRLAGVPPEKRRAIVVGASSGMGAALVRQLCSEGYRVAALARRQDKLDELAEECGPVCRRTGGAIFVHAHDVARAEDVPELFQDIVENELGGLHLIVYCAGIMPPVEAQEYNTEKDLAQVTVNLGGCIAWLNPAANLFRTQREGTIVGVSSIAGDRGRRGNPVYCTTKAAMNTYLEALRNRLGEHGPHVCTIKPGFIDTPMTEGLDGLFWVISAEKAASSILAAARNRVNTRYVPMRWRAVGTIIKLIPSFLFRKLDI